jgi:hypothetical protein
MSDPLGRHVETRAKDTVGKHVLEAVRVGRACSVGFEARYRSQRYTAVEPILPSALDAWSEDRVKQTLVGSAEHQAAHSRAKRSTW